jgi:hypothetical protein
MDSFRAQSQASTTDTRVSRTMCHARRPRAEPASLQPGIQNGFIVVFPVIEETETTAGSAETLGRQLPRDRRTEPTSSEGVATQ